MTLERPGPPLDLRQLYYFFRTAEYGSFTKAARALNVAQPAISIAVRKLEETLGMEVLRRTKTGVELTIEGKMLFVHARGILASLESARTDLASLRGLKIGSTTIGIPPQFFSGALIEPIISFMHHYPGLHMKIVDLGATRLRTALIEGAVDLAVLSEDDLDPSFDVYRLFDDELVVVAARGHEILENGAVEAQQIELYPLAIINRRFWQSRVADRVFDGSNEQANIRFECPNIAVLKAAVRHSEMITTLVRGSVADDDALAWRSFSPPVYISAFLCRRSRSTLSLANRALLSFLMEETSLGEPPTRDSKQDRPLVRAQAVHNRRRVQELARQRSISEYLFPCTKTSLALCKRPIGILVNGVSCDFRERKPHPRDRASLVKQTMDQRET